MNPSTSDVQALPRIDRIYRLWLLPDSWRTDTRAPPPSTTQGMSHMRGRTYSWPASGPLLSGDSRHAKPLRAETRLWSRALFLAPPLAPVLCIMTNGADETDKLL